MIEDIVGFTHFTKHQQRHFEEQDLFTPRGTFRGTHDDSMAASIRSATKVVVADKDLGMPVDAEGRVDLGDPALDPVRAIPTDAECLPNTLSYPFIIPPSRHRVHLRVFLSFVGPMLCRRLSSHSLARSSIDRPTGRSRPGWIRRPSACQRRGRRRSST